ncbi:lactonase family protein [Paenibacillus mucilaginosus]|uniref:lactonase family protein n=1 Tax=Paenibacillus mucilaginosus TaxID=61624 RepID=UPI00240CE63F|nr:lactonase family protein [Paenibacillus mucilaginosus]WFA16388.1 lactonase family protein [Paenibacillus mucilaginosus]
MSLGQEKGIRMYIGTYSEEGEDSLFLVTMDSETGELQRQAAYAEVQSPSFVIRNEAGDRLYCVSEIDIEGRAGGGAAAYRIDPLTGEASFLGRQDVQGAAPCHLALVPGERRLVVANYSSGNVSVHGIGPGGELLELAEAHRHTGSSVHADRQGEPHPHCIVIREGFVYVPDLGKDRIVTYRLAGDAVEGILVPHAEAAVHAGAGPRHLVFHATLPYAYVANELDSTVTVFAADPAEGKLTEREAVFTLPEGYKGESYVADIHIHPNGRYLYVSNRGHDSIAVFEINQETGALRAVQHQSTLGRFPRNFAVTPDGRFLLAANQNSDSITVLEIREAGGNLSPAGRELSLPKPVCIRFLP